MVDRLDDQTLNPPDLAVGGMDGLAPATATSPSGKVSVVTGGVMLPGPSP